ncbi:hypothetical protein L873DRAFT_1737642 [Choiromyces venosus 120613-1]|uniref:HTH CENPB-type domain-containing protein n=1 Tax=Choiromyces venosus 120613-1 TaxID=1336337 RepID=A0A3N4JUS2_9PEZI|nr:hypothetical protein L873DRAFT_1737642 [Choiromyces venosus 120613-1]
MHDYCFSPRIGLIKDMALELKQQREVVPNMQIGIHWHLRFLERHPDLALKYSRQIEYLRCAAEQSYFILKGFFERVRYLQILLYNYITILVDK